MKLRLADGSLIETVLKHKRRDAGQSRSIGKPPTEAQAKLLEAIKNIPGLTSREYCILAFGNNFYFARKQRDAALKGLLSRGLVYLYAACDCGAELVKRGQGRKCKGCGNICSEAHVREDRIGIL